MSTDIDYIKGCGWTYKGCGIWKDSEGRTCILQRAVELESERSKHFVIEQKSMYMSGLNGLSGITMH